jgi:hypothetical protein
MAEQKKTRAPGAGVKADDGVTKTERKQVRLDAESAALLVKVGGGNLSLGIREAVRRLVENKDTQKFSAKRHALRQRTT